MKIGNIISVITGGVAGAVAGGAAIGNVMNKKLDARQNSFNKVVSYYHMFNQWLIIHQEGKSLVEYFEKNHYKTIAIYGMKEFGERLYDELEGSGIKVEYIIDKEAGKIYADVEVVKPDDDLRAVDAIVVTATYYFDEIEEMLAEKIDYPVISLEDILYEI